MNFKAVKNFQNRGIGLVELLVTSAIVLIAFIAFFYGLVACFRLAEVSKESLLVLQSANAKLEEIRQYNFANTYNYYNAATFEVAALPTGSSKGSIAIDNTNPNLLKVYIAVCWRSSDGRIIGEDKNLDGSLSPVEDVNSNNKIDSPIYLSTYVARH
ncbi:MAG: hypothetical protein AB1629_03165 [Candidatus Omnitrophota bacterium]